jgi:hypothetical protein
MMTENNIIHDFDPPGAAAPLPGWRRRQKIA